MKIKLHLNYHTSWGQNVFIYGSDTQLGNWKESKAVKMTYTAPDTWQAIIEIDQPSVLEYRFFVKENNNIVAREWGEPHSIEVEKNKDMDIFDAWQIAPHQQFLYTSGFSNSFFKHEESSLKYFKRSILLKVSCPFVKKGECLILTGSSKALGDWDIEKALQFGQTKYGEWQLVINATQIKKEQEYKLAILNIEQNKITHWEEGPNRILVPVSEKTDIVKAYTLSYSYNWMNWKAAGVAIPVFSLRSNDSFGIGEFSDLKKMIDWAKMTNQKIIQILPINDTTKTHSWVDSYPYNAISIYALHPIYLGLKAYPLKDQQLFSAYEKEASYLNNLSEVDYDKVLQLKWKYLKELFNEIGEETLKSKEYQDFYKQNEEWLFPYACFSYLRDKHNSPQFSSWKSHSTFNKKKLETLVKTEKEAKYNVDLLCFVQYLLHKQLVEVKEYAHDNDVILKGDIPIGISSDSVEAWVEPHLFNLDVQTGAPPDDFSVTGQNWGFPTYNWEEMSKDGYQWWVKRFRKMADYFDAYRIDHILGFFRIWEIPLSSVQGLLGYFSPALPLSAEEIRSRGLWFDEERMVKPYIHEHFLYNIFAEDTQFVIDTYLTPIEWQRFSLKEECDTQIKIKALFEGKNSIEDIRMRDGLYSLCNEVLFVRDKREPYKYHPRISAQFSYSYKDLDDNAKAAFNSLYDDFFYRRHSQYWREQAMQKLPPLIASTSMLVCGEDLGMVPECVPSVMNELQILSLEIERMPKDKEASFNALPSLPYLSVCTTSTHDMSPIRLWWTENRDTTQRYYNQVLWKHGAAPENCSTDICWQIVTNHLNSPAMLAILPLQDWLSIDGNLRRENAEEERINIPAIATHYWRYRMHISLEELMTASEFNNKLLTMIETSGRK